MSTFVLIPGAGGAAWYWHRVVPLLRAAGHDAIAVDLPGDDENAGLGEYARLVTGAIGGRQDVMLVAQSLGGFTAPLVATAVPVLGLVFVNAMIPQPGETPEPVVGQHGLVRGPRRRSRSSRLPSGVRSGRVFPARRATGGGGCGGAAPASRGSAVFGSVCEFDGWPTAPIRVVTGADDRFFPVEFQRKVARERLGLEADVLPGGHLIALARPEPLADYLLAI